MVAFGSGFNDVFAKRLDSQDLLLTIPLPGSKWMCDIYKLSSGTRATATAGQVLAAALSVSPLPDKVKFRAGSLGQCGHVNYIPILTPHFDCCFHAVKGR